MDEPQTSDHFSYTYEQCIIAIKKVASGRKPFAEVSGMRARKADLEYDLAKCLEKAGETGKVFYWIRHYGPEGRWRGLYRWRFGFYKYPWTLAALGFVDRRDLKSPNRDWIRGLFYGYKPRAIQKFLDKQKAGT